MGGVLGAFLLLCIVLIFFLLRRRKPSTKKQERAVRVSGKTEDIKTEMAAAPLDQIPSNNLAADEEIGGRLRHREEEFGGRLQYPNEDVDVGGRLMEG